MKHLLIIGARGYGREISIMATRCRGYLTEWDIKGFLDDNNEALSLYPGYPPIICSVEEYIPQKDDVFICALGDVHYKKQYVDLIISKHGHFINLIDSSAIVDSNISDSVGCIFSSQVKVSCDVKIGSFVTMQYATVIGHDAEIGNFTHFNARTFMGGFSKIGDLSTLSTGGIILPHAVVGNNCVVGAGSVVIRKVKDNTTVYGNPAKVLKY